MSALLLWLACAAPPPPPPVAQWVWTDADLPRLQELRRAHPDAVAGVHIGTIHHRDGALTTELSLAPTVAEAPRALVIRLEDDLRPAWDALTDAELAAELDAPLGRLLRLAASRGSFVEVQLDHDVPVRLLPRWANVLRTLRGGALKDQRVWVTSLVAHVAEPEYGPLLRGVVDGHILQVFDTGDDALDAARVTALANRAGLPWRWGLGAFERGGERPTNHRAWFTAPCLPPCEARWVFPAGAPYAELLQGAP
jgi:hypothetical protein